jgi:predicted small metal-binding protein
MRTADCPLCGEHLEAENDDELFNKGRAHADEKHGDQQITDEQIRQVPSHDA